MNGKCKWASLMVLAALSLALFGARLADAQAPAAAGAAPQAAPKYTMAEYNAYQAAAAEKNPASQIKLLDDFVSKYPSSALLVYVYPLYYQAYGAQKNYQRMIEYADKTAALGDKLDANAKYGALSAHAAAYNALLSDPATAAAVVKDTVM